jgi:uncharacterized protein YjbI with pentapeptide repeats
LARLQGTSLFRAQLQGASFALAAFNATDFSEAFLWRTNWEKIDQLETVWLEGANWKPVWPTMLSVPSPWDAKAYEELRGSMNSNPEGETRDDALRRIERLGCGNHDQNLASCDPAAALPTEVLDWQKTLSAANVDDAAYATALAKELRSLVCESGIETNHSLRGAISNGQFAETGREAHGLVDFI